MENAKYFTLDKSNISTYIDDIVYLFKDEWWTKERTKNHIIDILNNSSLIFMCTNIKSNKLIGFCRVITDFIDTAIILDVIIDRGYRKKGIGKELMNYVLSYSKIRSIDKFDLHCKQDLELFYGKLDFNKGQNGMIWMRKSR